MIKNELCKSCGACKNSCPKNAITMKNSKYGFYIPSINDNLCIHCGMCDKVCENTHKKNDKKEQECFAVRTLNKQILRTSRSGGFFMELARYVINTFDATVYGAVLNNNEPIYYGTNKIDELKKFSGSKYVWCDPQNVFKEIYNLLNQGKYVLFSGLPCQVAGIKAYLLTKNIDLSKFLTTDIVCHGCPSKKVFYDYLKMQEKKYKGSIMLFNFRNKEEFGWKAHIESFVVNGKIHYSDKYTRTFYSHYALNNACFYCEYKDIARVGDFSIADCWGIEKKDSVLNDDKGTSLVMVNNGKAKNIFSELISELYVDKIYISEYMQPALIKSVDKPKDYEDFWNEYNKGFTYCLKKYVNYNLKRRLRFIFKIIYYKSKKGKVE